MQLRLDDRQRCLLRLADSALILAQRNSEWCGHAPVLEEDLALANLSSGWTRTSWPCCAWSTSS